MSGQNGKWKPFAAWLRGKIEHHRESFTAEDARQADAVLVALADSLANAAPQAPPGTGNAPVPPQGAEQPAAPAVCVDKPRSGYVPLTEQRIDELQAVIVSDKENWPSKAFGREIEVLCAMANNALLYAEEIARLRNLPSRGTNKREDVSAAIEQEIAKLAAFYGTGKHSLDHKIYRESMERIATIARSSTSRVEALYEAARICDAVAAKEQAGPSSRAAAQCATNIRGAAGPRSCTSNVEAEKDEAYRQRNVLVASLARLFPSGVRRTNIEGWLPDWHGCVYIDLPTGQISYHYHDSQAYLFLGLPAYTKAWDNHTKADVERRLITIPPSATAQGDLLRLSDAATPGNISLNPTNRLRVRTSMDHPMCEFSEPYHRLFERGEGQDPEFMVALWNAFRGGDLVLRSSGSITSSAPQAPCTARSDSPEVQGATLSASTPASLDEGLVKAPPGKSTDGEHRLPAQPAAAEDPTAVRVMKVRNEPHVAAPVLIIAEDEKDSLLDYFEDWSGKLYIEFGTMTRAEIDALPEFDGF